MTSATSDTALFCC